MALLCVGVGKCRCRDSNVGTGLDGMAWLHGSKEAVGGQGGSGRQV